MGGGIANDAGTLVLERSLVSGNHASAGSRRRGRNPELWLRAMLTARRTGTKAVLALENSTVADNVARLGAGIVSATEDDVADENGVSIIDSTIADNKMEESCSTECFTRGTGAGLQASEGTIDVGGSIVADNTDTDLFGTTNANCSATSPATIVSLFSYDLENETDCHFTSTGDKQNTSPDFSSSELKNNGGNTDTLAPEPTAPLSTRSPPAFRSSARTLAARTRPQPGCDIGAVELTVSTFQATGIPGARPRACIRHGGSSPSCSVHPRRRTARSRGDHRHDATATFAAGRPSPMRASATVVTTRPRSPRAPT